MLNENTGQIISTGEELRNDREVRLFVESWAIERGMSMSVVSEDGRAIRFELRSPVVMTVTFSPQAADLIDRLSLDLAMSRDAVISQALVLLRIAADAIKSGKSFGVAISPDVLETEVVGLGTKPR